MSSKKKTPMQIYLRKDQVEALRSVAKKRGESMAALVREGIDKLLQGLPAEEDPLLEIIGLYDSGRGDLAEKHDEVLAEMITEEGDSET